MNFFTIVLMLLGSIFAYKNLEKTYKRNKITRQKSVGIWMLINFSIVLLLFIVLGRRSHDYYRYNLDFGYSY